MERHGKEGRPVDALMGHYKLGRTLGFGSFSKVKIAEHILTGHKVAIKVLNRRKIKNLDMEEKVRREIKILRLFMHPHIIRLYEVIETHADIYVVMEYVKSGELFDYIVEKGRLPEDEARRFFQQILSGVEYCHRNLVVHRDLKPENLLLDSNLNIKIVDFGLSNVIRDGHFLKTSCGSPNYAAPEVVSGKLYAGPEVDVWSCGVILYALLCGTLPFDDASIPNLFKKIKINGEVLQEVLNLGFERNQLVESLLNRIQDEATVSYYLLLDHRLHAPNGYFGLEFQETMDGHFSHVTSYETSTSALVNSLRGAVDNQRPNFLDQSKWTLGFQSTARPHEIMKEVVAALCELSVCWKNIGHYNMRCKWQPGSRGNSGYFVSNPLHFDHRFNNDFVIEEKNDGAANQFNTVKFEIQLYKTADEKYLLDVQRVEGPQLLFINLCASLFHQLRVQ